MANKGIRDPGSIQLRSKRIDEHTTGKGDAHAQEEARAQKSATDQRGKVKARKSGRGNAGDAGRPS